MSIQSRPLAVLGGMFDPIHLGHLRSAVELRDGLGLEAVLLMPCKVPPHRAQPMASVAQRLAMVNLAVANEPGLVVDERELARDGPSYSIDTLRSLRAERPGQPVCLVVGQDAFNGFSTWHQWRSIFDLAHVVVLSRPGGVATWSPELAAEVAKRRAEDASAVTNNIAGSVLFWPVTPFGVSSTSVRGLLSQGKSVRFLVPDGVCEYIRQSGLYK